jgi:hypothetical protein
MTVRLEDLSAPMPNTKSGDRPTSVSYSLSTFYTSAALVLSVERDLDTGALTAGGYVTWQTPSPVGVNGQSQIDGVKATVNARTSEVVIETTFTAVHQAERAAGGGGEGSVRRDSQVEYGTWYASVHLELTGGTPIADMGRAPEGPHSFCQGS